MKILLLLAALVFGQDEQPIVLNDFTCGLNTRYASHKIDQRCLKEATNVFVDEDLGIVKRTGYAKYNATALTDAKSVRGLWRFEANDGTRYIIAHSSTSMFYSNGQGSFTQIAMTTQSATAEMDCTQGLGRIWCTNGTDAVFSWDGSSTQTISGAPRGALIDNFRNRIWISDVSGARSTLYASGELDGTDWTTGAQSTSPVVFRIGGVNDGTRIRCLMGVYDDVLRIGKDEALYGLYGFDQDDFQVRELSREVGCIENKSVQEKDNFLIWLSKRGVEKYNGTSAVRITDQVRDLINTIIAASGNTISVTDTTQSDFASGNLIASGEKSAMSATLSPGSVVQSSYSRIDTLAADFGAGTRTNVSTNVISGSLVLKSTSSNNIYDDFTDGNFTIPTWVSNSGLFENCIVESKLSSNMAHQDGTSGECTYASSTYTLSSGEWRFDFVTNNDGSASPVMFGFGCNAQNDCGEADELQDGNMFCFTARNHTTDTINLVAVSANGSCNSIGSGSGSTRIASATYTLADDTRYHIKINRDDNNRLTVAINGVQELSAIDNSGLTFNTTGYTGFYVSYNGWIDNIYNPRYEPTGDLVSQNFDTFLSTPLGGTFNVTMSSASDAAITFEIQDSADGSSFGSLSSITPGAVVTHQRRYWRYKPSFTSSVSTKTPQLDDVTLSAKTTGYFIGQCRNPGSGNTSWGTFNCSTTDNSGSFAFAISTGATCHEVTRATATWNTQINNSVITAPLSTGYTSYRAFLNATDGTNSPTLADCTMNWNAGTSRPPIASAIYKDRYLMAFTTSTAASAYNEHILSIDSKDKPTILDNINAYSMVIYDRKLYTGNSNINGYVYLQDSGSADDGSNYTAFFRTKDLDAGDPDTVKVFSKVYAEIEPRSDSAQSVSITARYYLDRSTTPITLGTYDLSESSSLASVEFPFPVNQDVAGKYISIEFINTGQNQVFKIYTVKLYFRRNEVQ